MTRLDYYQGMTKNCNKLVDWFSVSSPMFDFYQSAGLGFSLKALKLTEEEQNEEVEDYRAKNFYRFENQVLRTICKTKKE